MLTLKQLSDRLELVEAANARHEAELRRLRKSKMLPDGESVEALLAHVRDEFNTTPWTSAMVLEVASENPVLLGAVKRCCGPTFTVQKLSRLLTQSVGPCGELELRCLDSHSRDGALFSVTNSVTRSQIKGGRVSQR
jgi:hypothetical protein